MKRIVLILLILTIPSLAIAQNPSRHELNRSLDHISQLVDQGKYLMGTNLRHFKTLDDYMAHCRKTKKKLQEAENYVARNIYDPYYSALSYLLISEAYACNLPEIPQPLERKDNKTLLWYPYKDVMRNLDSALSRIVWLKKGTYANR